jgi:hypothetical protein
MVQRVKREPDVLADGQPMPVETLPKHLYATTRPRLLRRANYDIERRSAEGRPEHTQAVLTACSRDALTGAFMVGATGRLAMLRGRESLVGGSTRSAWLFVPATAPLRLTVAREKQHHLGLVVRCYLPRCGGVRCGTGFCARYRV